MDTNVFHPVHGLNTVRHDYANDASHATSGLEVEQEFQPKHEPDPFYQSAPQLAGFFCGSHRETFHLCLSAVHKLHLSTDYTGNTLWKHTQLSQEVNRQSLCFGLRCWCCSAASGGRKYFWTFCDLMLKGNNSQLTFFLLWKDTVSVQPVRIMVPILKRFSSVQWDPLSHQQSFACFSSCENIIHWHNLSLEVPYHNPSNKYNWDELERCLQVEP